jgi:hypothetical protein
MRPFRGYRLSASASARQILGLLTGENCLKRMPAASRIAALCSMSVCVHSNVLSRVSKVTHILIHIIALRVHDLRNSNLCNLDSTSQARASSFGKLAYVRWFNERHTLTCRNTKLSLLVCAPSPPPARRFLQHGGKGTSTGQLLLPHHGCISGLAEYEYVIFLTTSKGSYIHPRCSFVGAEGFHYSRY